MGGGGILTCQQKVTQEMEYFQGTQASIAEEKNFIRLAGIQTIMRRSPTLQIYSSVLLRTNAIILVLGLQ